MNRYYDMDVSVKSDGLADITELAVNEMPVKFVRDDHIYQMVYIYVGEPGEVIGIINTATNEIVTYGGKQSGFAAEVEQQADDLRERADALDEMAADLNPTGGRGVDRPPEEHPAKESEGNNG